MQKRVFKQGPKRITLTHDSGFYYYKGSGLKLRQQFQKKGWTLQMLAYINVYPVANSVKRISSKTVGDHMPAGGDGFQVNGRMSKRNNRGTNRAA